MDMELSGQPVFDAVEELRALSQLGYPYPPGTQLNCFLNPLGPLPARGWFCLTRDSVNQLDLNGTHTVVITDDLGVSVPLYNLLIATEPLSLTPGTIGDPNAVFLVEVADMRHMLSAPTLGVTIDDQYNVLAPGFFCTGATPSASQFYADSLQSGTTVWTWQHLVTDIWSQLTPLGTNSTLPFTPDGTPYGWKFPGVSAWEALNRVLMRLGCAVRFDPTVTSNQYSIVRVGADDATTLRAITAAERRLTKIFDREYLPIARGRIAGTVNVAFHTVYENYGTEQTTPRTAGDQWSTNAVQLSAQTSDYTGADPDTATTVWDDLPAMVDGDGSVTNAAAIASRAAERLADYLRTRTVARLDKIFSRILPGVVAPGSQIKGVCWRQDLGGIGGEGVGGLITEIIAHPYYTTQAAPDGTFRWEDSTYRFSDDQPPDLAPTYPVYPHLLQVVEVLDTPNGDGQQDATVMQYDPATGTWNTKESVWARDLDADDPSGLAAGLYLMRLVGCENGRPIYAGVCCNSAGRFSCVDRSANYTLVQDDVGTLQHFAPTAIPLVATLPDPATLDLPWSVFVENSGTNYLTVNTTAGLIDGLASVILLPDQGMLIVATATGFCTERGRFRAGIKIITASSYTVLVNDWGYLLSFQGAGTGTPPVVTVTVPQMPNGWFADFQNALLDKQVNVTDASTQAFALRYTNAIRLFSDGTNTLGGNAGLTNYLHLTKVANYTVVANDIGRQVSFQSASDLTATLDTTCASLGWSTVVENNGSGLLTITPAGGKTINGTASIYLYGPQSVRITTDGTNYWTANGKQISTLTNITTATYTISALDYALTKVVTYSGGHCAITWPASGLPSDFYVQIINDGGTDKVTTISGSSDAYALTYRRSGWFHSNGAGRFSDLAGQHFYGVAIKTANYTITKADFSRMIACNPAAGNHFDLTLDAANSTSTTADPGFGVRIMNYGADYVRILPSGNRTIDGNNQIPSYNNVSPMIVEPGECVWVGSEGNNYFSDRGRRPLERTVVSGNNYTVLLTDYGRMIQLQNAGNVAVSLPQMPKGWYCYINKAFPSATGFATVTDGNSHKSYVRYGMSTYYQYDGTADVNGLPGQTILGSINYSGNRTLTWEHHARLVVNTGGAVVYTLDDDSTFVDGFTTILRNRGNGTMTVATTKAINGLSAGTSFQVPPCCSVIIASDGLRYEISTGYFCEIPYEHNNNYTVTSQDHQSAQVYDGANNATVTISNTGNNNTLYAGFNFRLYNISAKTVTLSPAGGTINGSATAAIPPRGWADVCCDGVGYYAGISLGTGTGAGNTANETYVSAVSCNNNNLSVTSNNFVFVNGLYTGKT